MLLTVNKLKKSFRDRVIFKDVSFGIDEHDKIGFIGANGAGKSTLIKILIGEMAYDSGDIFKNKNLEVGYLDQYSCNDSEKTVLDETLDAFSDLLKIENELDVIRYKLENSAENISALIERQTNLTEKFEKKGGYTYRGLAKSTLTGLGFSENDFDLPVSMLSGGQKTRISLAKILLSGANLLLLDEPTNHLDIESVEWLENFLRNYNGAFIIISHDRYFLDKVTNKTFSLEGSKFYSMNANYSSFAEQRDIERLTEERNYNNTIREIERLEKIVEQQRRWNREKNIKTAESKLKVINRLKETLVEPVGEEKEARFRFKSHPGGGNDALIVENLKVSFPDAELFQDVNIHINKGEKVFLLGANGSGKSTILKSILGLYQKFDGKIKIGANTLVGYYDQLQENLDIEKTIIDEIWDEYPKLTQTEIRNALAAFLFCGEDVFKEIKKLSGGERAKVELVKLILKDVNFLIMDEPTNHLDIQSREALEKALSEYDGTLLVVSHDRYFINSLSTRILKLDEKGITSYFGNYDDYLEYRSSSEPVKIEKVQSDSGISYKEQKRIESEKRKIKNRFSKIEKEIFELENQIELLNEQMQTPKIALDYVKASEISNEILEKNELLDKLYKEWEDIQITMEE